MDSMKRQMVEPGDIEFEPASTAGPRQSGIDSMKFAAPERNLMGVDPDKFSVLPEHQKDPHEYRQEVLRKLREKSSVEKPIEENEIDPLQFRKEVLSSLTGKAATPEQTMPEYRQEQTMPEYRQYGEQDFEKLSAIQDPYEKSIMSAVMIKHMDPDDPNLKRIQLESGKAHMKILQHEAKQNREFGRMKVMESWLAPTVSTLRAAGSAMTFGLSEIAYKSIERMTGVELRGTDSGSRVMEASTLVLMGLLSGRMWGKQLQSLKALKALSPLKQAIYMRMGISGAQAVGTNAVEVAFGDVSLPEALKNVGIALGAGVVGMIPALRIPAGTKAMKVLNAAGQIVTDFVYDLATDVTLKGHLQQQGFKKWFLNEEIYQLLPSIISASMDFADPNFAQTQKMLNSQLRSLIKSDWHNAGTKGSDVVVKPDMEKSAELLRIALQENLDPEIQAKVRQLEEEAATQSRQSSVDPEEAFRTTLESTEDRALADKARIAASSKVSEDILAFQSERMQREKANIPEGGSITGTEQIMRESSYGKNIETETGKAMPASEGETEIRKAVSSAPEIDTMRTAEMKAAELSLGEMPDARRQDDLSLRATARGTAIDASTGQSTASGFRQRMLDKAAAIRRAMPGPLRKAMDRIELWASRNLTERKGLQRELFSRTKQYENEKIYRDIHARASGKEGSELRAKLLKNGIDKKIIDASMMDVLQGDITVDQFQQQFKLSDSDVKILSDYHDYRVNRSEKLANLLERAGYPDELVETIKNAEYYTTRKSQAVFMGTDFVPDPNDRRMVVDDLTSRISKEVASVSDSATEMKKRIEGDVFQFMQTRDIDFLRSLDPKTKKEFIGLSDRWAAIKDVVDELYYDGNELLITTNTDAIINAAESYIDYKMSRYGLKSTGKGQASVPIINLLSRKASPAWRRMMGEITDPVFVMRKTEETQGRLIESLTFYERLFQEGDGIFYSNMQNREKGHMVQLGERGSVSSIRRYGKMAGAWVSPEFMYQLQGSHQQSFVQAYLDLKSTTRLLKLFGPRTIWRNYTTNIMNYAMQCGDVALPGYWKNLKQANLLWMDVMRGKPKALRALADLVQNDAIRVQGNSFLEDVTALMGDTKATSRIGIKLQSLKRKSAQLYAYIDLPGKVASYWTKLEQLQRQAGVTTPTAEMRQEASDHVRKFYQYPDAIPEVFRTISKLPLGDYPVFFADSIRLTKNAMVHAVQEARKGNMVPAMGFIAARSWNLFQVNALKGAAMKAWQFMRNMRGIKDRDAKKLDDDQEQDLRQIIAPYYGKTPLLTFSRRGDTGEKELIMAVTSGQTGFPVEDMIMGAMQCSQSIWDIPKIFGQELASKYLAPGTGMFDKALIKALTGLDTQTGYDEKGIIELMSDRDTPKEIANVFLERITDFGIDVWGGQIIPNMTRIYEAAYKTESDKDPYSRGPELKDVIRGMIEPVRIYRIEKKKMRSMIKAAFSRNSELLKSAKSSISREQNALRKDGQTTVDMQWDSNSKQTYRINQLHKLEGVYGSALRISDGILPPSEVRAILSESSIGLTRDEEDAIVAKSVSQIKPYISQERKSSLQKYLYGGGKLKSIPKVTVKKRR